LELQEPREKEGDKGIFLSQVWLKLKGKGNLHDVPKLVRQMRKQGLQEMFYSRAVVWYEDWEREVDLYLTSEGDLIVKDLEVWEILQSWAYGMRVYEEYDEAELLEL